jgi:hypothetical protein
MSYDRYSKFRSNGTIKFVPFIPIKEKSTDLYDYYKEGETRLDLLSYQYYEDPNYDWLIMQANPEYGSLEYQIPNGAKLRIPYPLDATLMQYNSDIDTYNVLYGVN